MSFNCKLRFGIKKQPHRGFLSNSPGAEGNAVWLFVCFFFFSGQHDLFRHNYLALLRKHKPLVRAAELVIKCMISPSLLTQVLQQPMSSEKNKCGRTQRYQHSVWSQLWFKNTSSSDQTPSPLNKDTSKAHDRTLPRMVWNGSVHYVGVFIK